MSEPLLAWRAMRAADLAAVSAIAAEIHPTHPERDEVFAERLALDPEGCRVLAPGEAVAGYVLSHPWHALSPPALDSFLSALPERPETYYIHDVALRPAVRGRGAGRAIVAALRDRARRLGLKSLSLVAVDDAATYWRAAGFSEADVLTPETLRSYGAGALFMTRDFGASE